jgi:hypothetical protein
MHDLTLKKQGRMYVWKGKYRRRPPFLSHLSLFHEIKESTFAFAFFWPEPNEYLKHLKNSLSLSLSLSFSLSLSLSLSISLFHSLSLSLSLSLSPAHMQLFKKT